MTNHPIKGKYVIIVISIFSTQPNPLQISRGTLVTVICILCRKRLEPDLKVGELTAQLFRLGERGPGRRLRRVQIPAQPLRLLLLPLLHAPEHAIFQFKGAVA
jgi:hypothetical protein